MVMTALNEDSFSANHLMVLESPQVRFQSDVLIWLESPSKSIQGPSVLEYKKLFKSCSKRGNARFVPPKSIDEMVNVLRNTNRDTGLFWTPIKKINSTSYTYGPGTGSRLFDESDNFGLEFKLHHWKDPYFPIGYGMVLRLYLLYD